MTLLLYWIFLRSVALSFSGFGSVPLLHAELVEGRHLLTDADLNTAVALSQASPGPLGLYVVVVGYFIAGVPGAIAGLAALATPALLAVPLYRLVKRQGASFVYGATTGVILAAAALMLVTGVRMSADTLKQPITWVLALAGFAVLSADRLSPLWVVVLSALIVAGISALGF